MKTIMPYFSGLFALFLVACGGEPSPPSDVISRDDMVKILTEIHLNEATIGKFNLAAVDSSKLLTEYMNYKLFQKFDTDSAAFRRSYAFYSRYPKTFEGMYQQIVKDLETKNKNSDPNNGPRK